MKHLSTKYKISTVNSILKHSHISPIFFTGRWLSPPRIGIETVDLMTVNSHVMFLLAAVLPGRDFTLDVHSIIFGKSTLHEATSFYGNMRNFYFNEERLFDNMRSDTLVNPTPATESPDPGRDFDGYSWIMYDLELMPRSYLRQNDQEDFEVIFRTRRPDGLIWFTGDERNNMYLAMKVGHVSCCPVGIFIFSLAFHFLLFLSLLNFFLPWSTNYFHI